jgi:hypothetical protein
MQSITSDMNDVKAEKAYIVKFFNGDVKEYQEDGVEQLIDAISCDLEIDYSLIKLLKNEEEEQIDYFVLIQESKDYPFNCWETYFPVFTNYLSSDNQNLHDSPKYSVLRDEEGFDLDIQIMNDLLENGNDPQKGLKELTKACIDACRYSYEIIPMLNDTFKKMLEKGATIDEDILKMVVTPNYSDHKDFENDMGRILTAKAFLLNMFLSFDGVKNVLIKIIPEWDQIVPVYWEYMLEIDPSHRYLSVLDYNYTYIDAYYKALKHEMTDEDE